jgi:hypothetical protein
MRFDKELMDVNFFELEEIRRKFEMLDINNASFNVVNYVKYLIKDTYIEMFGIDMCSADKLIYDRKLEGYCFESTSIMISNFNDDDYISRGNLYWTSNSDGYLHSWINFSLHGCDYVFDPTLSLLCLKKMYDELFNVSVISEISSRRVNDELIGLLNMYDEVLISGSKNIDDNFYGNDIKVRGKVKKNNISKLYASY